MPRRPSRLPSRRRLLAIGKWAGLIACVAIAGVWVASQWMTCYWVGRGTNRAGLHVRFGHGQFGVGRGLPLSSRGVGRFGRVHLGIAGGPVPHHGIGFPYHGSPRWQWGGFHIALSGKSQRSMTYLQAPLWAPFFLAAAPTSLMWWRSRRSIPGHCRCGYSLAGLEGKPCPECGRGAG
jgi:hypothetical protein